MDIDTLRIETPRLILRPTRWEDFDAGLHSWPTRKRLDFSGECNPAPWRGAR